MVTCFLKTDLSSMHSMKNLADKKEYSLTKNNSGWGRRKKIARITCNKFLLPVLGWDGMGWDFFVHHLQCSHKILAKQVRDHS